MIPGMILPRFEYEAPPGLGEATALLASGGGDACVLGGGTDLLVKMKRGVLKTRLVVSLRRIGGLDAVERTDAGLRVGALATMAQVAADPRVSGPWTGLAEGAAAVGGPIIRNRATVGGNIVNARPCADSAAPLIALDARLRLQGARGTRVVEIDGFIKGPGATAIAPDEILTAIDVPAPASTHSGSCYIKITRRAAMEVTIAGCAASVDLDAEARRITRARIVFSSVGPTPVRARDAERMLEGQVADEALLRAASAVARQAATPIDDSRAPGWYRSQVVDVLARRALTQALERAGWRARS